jgi:Domain of unknown function (DUF4340)
MNWKSTLALALLAGGAAVWFFKADDWGPDVGLKSAHPEPPKSAAAGDLDALSPGTLTRVEIAFQSGDPLAIERANPQAEWKMPGNWPLRTAEVGELVEILGNLRTRFHAVPLPEGAGLSAFGLAPDQKPIVVKLTANGQKLTLTFGEPKIAAGETAFTRPAFVRVNDLPEVLKLGPDVMPVVRRSADSYRRRQLFTDVERVKIADAGPPPPPFGGPAPGGDAPVTVSIPGPDTAELSVHGPGIRFFGFDLAEFDPRFTLKRSGKLPEPGVMTKGGEPALTADRLADAWRIVVPVQSNVEPSRLRSVLAAVADLWVDQFVPAADAKFALDSRFALAQLMPIPFESPLALAVRAYPEAGYLDPLRSKIPVEDRANFPPPDQSRGVRMTLNSRPQEPVHVRFGGIAKITEREEPFSVPAGPPGTPPRTVTRKIPTEYRYARIDGNPQVFVVSAEKFPDLFVSAAELIDPRVARFEIDEVQEVVLSDPEGKQPVVKLTRKKGNPNAKKDEEKRDRWFLDAQPNPLLADTGRVTELLTRLAGLRADSASRREYKDTPRAALFSITIVAREKRAEGEPDAPARVFNLRAGYPNTVKHLLPVWLVGQQRESLVDDRLGPDAPDSWISSWLFPDTLSAMFTRPPLSYRSRELFDTGSQLETVTVAGGFTLKKEAGDWKLTAPLTSEADPAAANSLAENLTRLAATEYLTATATPADLESFGLAKPRHSVALGFSGGHTYTLDLGGPRLGKPEVFARLDGGAVFGLPNAAAEQLTTGAVGLLPLRVWAALPEKITALEITRFGESEKESFALTKDAGSWKLTRPFAAPVPNQTALPMLGSLGNLSAVKYQALSSTNDAEFGFDKPFLKVKLAFLEKKPEAMEEAAVVKTLLVGGLAPDGVNRYARLEMPNAPVFIVPSTFVFSAQVPPLELLDRSLLTIPAKLITKVAVTGTKPEDAVTLVKGGAAWKVEGAAFAVDAERSGQLASVVANLPVSHLAAYGDAIKWGDFGLEPPEFTVTISVDPEMPGGKANTFTLQLGKADSSGGRFARVLGKNAVGVVPAQIVAMLTRKKFDYADRTLLTFDPTTLVGLSRTLGKDTLELAPAAAVGWDIVKPVKQKADQQFVEEVAESLSRLRADRVAAFGKKDEVFKQHGLDTPEAIITVTVGDKAEQKTLRIGNPVQLVKPDADRFVAVDSANAEVIVGVLPAALANKLLSPSVAFRDHTLAKFVDADKAVLERGDRKLTFAKVGVTWKLTEPLAAPAESAELEALVADLGKLRADTWVAEKGKDLKASGLDKPEAKWTVFDGDKPVLVLLLGKKAADGRVHVATDKGELVGLLDLPMTGRVLAEYRLRRAWDVDAAQVDSVEMAQGAAKFTLEKAGQQWVDPAKPADMIDVRVVTELLGTLGGLKVEQYAADKDATLKLFGLEKPEMTLTAVMRGGTAKRTLEIGGAVGGTDGKQRYARVVDKDRSDVFILSSADTARLMRDRAMYVLKK